MEDGGLRIESDDGLGSGEDDGENWMPVGCLYISYNEAVAVPGASMTFDSTTTAVVITDPQNDFLSPDGATWELVGNSVTENRTVEHLEQLLQGAKSSG